VSTGVTIPADNTASVIFPLFDGINFSPPSHLHVAG
jgi:hypothetical protein